MTRVLALDVGGTNVRFAIAEVEARSVTLTPPVYAKGRDFGSLEDALDAHRSLFAGGAVERVSIAVAGPVVDGVCHMSNLSWTVDARAIERATGLPTRVMNDFEAIALGVRYVPADALATLQEGKPIAGAAIAILGAGTGLGETLLVPTDAGDRVIASEGGHATLAALDDEDARFIAFMRKRLDGGHVSVERAVSGSGLAAIFEWMEAEGLAKGSDALHAALRDGDAGAAIGAAGTSGSDRAARAAVDRFVRFYGAEAGDLALKSLPHGGVFVAGGIAAKILPRMREGFMAPFLDKGRMRALLETIPVHVILDGDIGLRGAASAR